MDNKTNYKLLSNHYIFWIVTEYEQAVKEFKRRLESGDQEFIKELNDFEDWYRKGEKFGSF